MKKSLCLLLVIVLLLSMFAFVGCNNTVETITSEDGKWEYVINDDDTITLVSINEMTENMVIPSSIDSHTVSTFGEKLFVVINDGKENKKFDGVYDDNNILKTVKIEANIKVIPNMCFYLCRKLTDVTFPDTLEKISDFAFYGCSELSNIELPEKCNSLGAYTFRECGNLKNVVINYDGVPDVGDKCFYMVNNKASNDDQYYIIPNLSIKVKNIELFSLDALEAKRKETRNNSYKYWKEYVSNECVGAKA